MAASVSTYWSRITDDCDVDQSSSLFAPTLPSPPPLVVVARKRDHHDVFVVPTSDGGGGGAEKMALFLMSLRVGGWVVGGWAPPERERAVCEAFDVRECVEKVLR